MVWTSSVETALLPTNDSRVSPLREGREQNGRQTPTVAPSSFLITVVLGTNTFVLKTFFSTFSSVLFDRKSSDV